MTDFEKLGVLYLGREFEPASGKATDVPLLYDAKDLTTHALCVGMTGSGKTGLCVSLLEEAAIDGIPAIVIDPKGDLANLLLAFPELRPEDFAPWMDPAEATRQGIAPDALAAKTAQAWRDGLAAWGQAPDRIARFRDAADAAIYTPGSQAGLPISVLRSFVAPPEKLRDDPEAFQNHIQSTVSGLLALVGIAGDPLTSREHVLISNLLSHAWSRDEALTLDDLIRGIQTPPFDRLGVLDLETYFPLKGSASTLGRQELAIRLNGVFASPGFALWMEGEPLNIQRILYTPEGKPRIAIFSIAHLTDAQRMFFVTLLLNEVIAWMRNQPGTSSLRALLYMDEIFGFFPPTANPPSKGPMLTLLKQARAFGVGCVLATQNPVDLDYKGLSNCGTWFLGRLQTERDKARILDGLEGATQGAGRAFDRATIDKMLSGLGKRVFLMNNVHEDAPVLFQTRWALSYLGGPMTRAQIEKIMAEKKALLPRASAEESAWLKQFRGAGKSDSTDSSTNKPPTIPPSIPQVFLKAERPVSDRDPITYQPAILAEVKAHYVNATTSTDVWRTCYLLAEMPQAVDAIAWPQDPLAHTECPSLDSAHQPGAKFGALPGFACQPKTYQIWTRSVHQVLYQYGSLSLRHCPTLKLTSRPGESEGDFRVRIRDVIREQRDKEIDEIRKKHAAKIAPLDTRIRAAEGRVQKETSEYQEAKMQSMLSAGASVLGALLGRRKLSVTSIRSVGTTMGRMSRAGRQRDDIGRAEASLDTLRQQRDELEASLAEELARLQAAPDDSDILLDEISLPPRKSDIAVAAIRLAWLPVA